MNPRRKPLPEIRLLVVAFLLTAAAYLIGFEVYEPRRLDELQHRLDALRKEQPQVADIAARAVEEAGGRLPLAAPPSLRRDPNSAPAVFVRVERTERLVRAFNRAVGDKGRELWKPQETARAGVDGYLIPSSEIAMWFGPEQAVALVLVAWSLLILSWLSREVRRELRAIQADPQLDRRAAEALTPVRAAQLAEQLEESLKPGLEGHGAYHDRERVWSYPLVCSKLLKLYAFSGNLEATQRLQLDEVESAWESFHRRLTNVEYAIYAAPVLKFLGTLRNMRAGLIVAYSPENMSDVIGFMGYSFDATVVALFVLLPLIFATKLFARRLAGLRLALKDASDGLIGRLGPAIELSSTRAEHEARQKPDPAPVAVAELPPDSRDLEDANRRPAGDAEVNGDGHGHHAIDDAARAGAGGAGEPARCGLVGAQWLRSQNDELLQIIKKLVRLLETGRIRGVRDAARIPADELRRG